MDSEADEEAGQANDQLSHRVNELESGQSAISAKVDQILGLLGKDKDKVHGAAEQHTEAKLDRPSNVADEIRQQLDERDRKTREDAEKQAAGSELAELRAKVAELTEKPPEPMPRRIEKIMWGAR